jgi:nucleoside-diphosphate-sugar epimerase
MNPAVLLTGATGYIGGRLLRHFEGAGRPMRCLRGIPSASEQPDQRRRSFRVAASMRSRWTSRPLAWTRLTTWCTSCRSGWISRRLIGRRLQLRCAAARAAVRHIICLGGLADQTASLSRHLQSRAETGSVLRASRIRVMPPSRTGRAVADRTAVTFRTEKPVAFCRLRDRKV